MQKILKLTGVSMLAVMATSNANAAGYTCEELIEYTSCNDGYYLNSGKCIEGTACAAGNYLVPSCPDGYAKNEDADEEGEYGWCYSEDADFITGYWLGYETQEQCEDESHTWFGPGCVESTDDDAWYDDTAFVPFSYVCTACGAGTYQNAAGQYACNECSVGTYQPNTGQTSCIDAPIGNYVSNTGATGYTACPVSDLTDTNGNVVDVTTASTGSTSINACLVAKGTEFKDTKGTYHFKSDCSYSASIATSDGCALLGGVWDDFSGDCSGVDGSVNPGKDFVYEDGVCKSQLEYAGSEYIEEDGGSVSWNGEYCECSGTWWYTDQEVVLYCQE